MTNTNQPRHIGFILDGNRRWAKEKGLSPMKGHYEGYKKLKELATYALKDKKIEFVSAYVFSTENWNRTKEEVGYLMKLVLRALTDYLEEFHRDNIKVVILGSRQKLSKSLLGAIEQAETKTKDNTGGTLGLCFNYGGHTEIVEAVNNILQSGPKESISQEEFEGSLYHPEIPAVDMIVRTSGEQRISGFMLYRASYSELLFVPKFWPDFNKKDIDEVINEYGRRQRRYGK